MSHDVFTRKDALRQDIPSVTPITPELQAAAQRVVAANSESSDECAQFLAMLGINERITE